MMVKKTPACRRGFFVFFILLGMGCSRSASSGCDNSIEVPDGFCATLFADGVGPARHLAVSKSGTVYAALWREGQRTCRW